MKKIIPLKVLMVRIDAWMVNSDFTAQDINYHEKSVMNDGKAFPMLYTPHSSSSPRM